MKQLSNNYLTFCLVFGLLVCAPTAGWIATRTFILLDLLGLIFLVSMIVSFCIHFLLVRDSKKQIPSIILLSFFGYGGIGLALFLSLNFFIHSPENELIIPLKYTETASENEIVCSWETTDPMFRDYHYMLSFEVETNPINIKQARMVVADGCLGYKVLISKALVEDK